MNQPIYLFIVPFFPSTISHGGSYLYDQVSAVVRNSDYNVIVLEPKRLCSIEKDYEFGGVKVYRFTDYNLPSNVWPNALTDALSIRSMFRKLEQIGVDIHDIAVAHGHVTRFGVWANALKRRNPRIRSIVQHHGFDVMSVTDGRLANFDFHRWHLIKYGRKICNETDLNVGVSRKTLEYLKAVPGIKLKREYVLYNGVDTTKFHPAVGSQKRSGEFTIGCVANFWELKDQMTLIKAVHELVKQGYTQLRTIFIGTGYTRSQCMEYVADNNLARYIDFIDSKPHDELPDFYRSLDLFILPSYWEAFGCVYTEAYCCGVPFIGVKGQGIAEVLEPECRERWLISKGDSARLADLIKKSIDNPRDMPQVNISLDINVLVRQFLNALY